MKQQEIDYIDIVELGFKIEECQDNVWMMAYGYPYKVITKKLNEHHHLHWEQNTRLCYLWKTDEEGTILTKHPIENYQDLIYAIDKFSENPYISFAKFAKDNYS